MCITSAHSLIIHVFSRLVSYFRLIDESLEKMYKKYFMSIDILIRYKEIMAVIRMQVQSHDNFVCTMLFYMSILLMVQNLWQSLLTQVGI